jgi:hypothetical protein
MSDIARFWSRNLKGLNFAEHAVCRELAEFHVSEMDLCYPNMGTIGEIYECSRPYLKKILSRLDSWRLVTRVEWFDQAERNRQTSNRYKLNLRQHFPDPVPEGRTTRDKNKAQTARPYDNRDHAAIHGAKAGRRVLSAINKALPNGRRGLLEGMKECFFDAPSKTTFVTVESETFWREILPMLPDLTKFCKHETNLEFNISLVPLFYRQKVKR